MRNLADYTPTPGECYRDAAILVLDGWLPPGAVLCHGRPRLQRPSGGHPAGARYGHAWVELGGWVFDHRYLTTPFPRAFYYRHGHIEEEEVLRYTAEEARQAILKHEHWGPWPD